MTSDRIPGGEVEAAIGRLGKVAPYIGVDPILDALMHYPEARSDTRIAHFGRDLRTLLASYRSLTEQVAGLTRGVEQSCKAEAALHDLAESYLTRAEAAEARANALEAAGREGWVLVPLEPDARMRDRGGSAIFDAPNSRDVDDLAAIAYRAMLSARPASPAAPALTASGEEAKPDPAGLVEALRRIAENDLPDSGEKHTFSTARELARQALAEHRGAKP